MALSAETPVLYDSGTVAISVGASCSGGDHGRHHLGEKGDGHTLVRLLFKQHGVRAGMVKRRGARRNLRLVGRGRGQGREQQGGYENKA